MGLNTTTLAMDLGMTIAMVKVVRDRLQAVAERDRYTLTKFDLQIMLNLLDQAVENLANATHLLAEAIDAGEVRNGT